MKKKILGLFLAGCMLAGSLPMSALADAQKVVTLGADLSEDQRTAILRYFGILGNAAVDTLTITNQDERNHLSSYVPIEQIGTRTYSCALVNPTATGGIQVKTANLNWVTGNMIASTLSTAGVVNCEVLAAAPFEVSGTGALTGVIMAYEQASGTTLDTTKKELATQELVTTGTIANQVGQTQATNIVNEVKIQIIEGQVVDSEEVDEIVDDVVDDTVTVELSAEDKQLLKDLAQQIAQQQYNYDDVKETLQRVEENTAANTNNNTNNNNTTINITTGDQNVNADASANASADATNTETEAPASAENAAPETEAADSILANTDVSALEDLTGTDVVTTTTDEPETEVQSEAAAQPDITVTPEQPESAAPEGNSTQDGGLVITTTDDYNSDAGVTDQPESTAPEQAEQGAEVTDGIEIPSAETDAQPSDADVNVDEQTAEQNEVLDGAELILDQPVVFDLSDTDMGEKHTGLDTISILIPKADVQVESGTLEIKDNTDGEGVTLQTVDLSAQALQAVTTAMTDEEVLAQGWNAENGGTRLVIRIDSAMALSGTYNLAASLQAVDATGAAAVLDVNDQYTVETQHGVQIQSTDINAYRAGGSLTATYSLDESAVGAYVSDFDAGFVNVTEVEGGFTLDLLQPGTTELTVAFTDAEGNVVDTQVVALTIL